MSNDKDLPKKSTRSEIDSFLRRVAETPAVKPAARRGRLIFAMDATASRSPTWDHACHIQAQMFNETARLGGLEIQLCYFRGFGEFHAYPWMSRSEPLLQAMTSVNCQAGQTQIRKVLQHTVREAKAGGVDALVYVGDCMEEDPDDLTGLAGQLGLLGVPVFLFHEGAEPLAARAFREIARLTRGAYCPFDASSPQQLRDLLSAVAVYAAGGRKALVDFGRRTGGIVRQLTRQLDRR